MALRQARLENSRRDARLAAVDPRGSRVSELAGELDQLRASVASLRDTDRGSDGEQQAVVRSLRDQVSSVSGTLEATTSNLRELGATVERLDQEAQERAALRQEVRELAARSAELSERLEETERLARTAGKAIASAVRRSRNAQQRSAQGGQQPFFQAETRDEPGDRPTE